MRRCLGPFRVFRKCSLVSLLPPPAPAPSPRAPLSSVIARYDALTHTHETSSAASLHSAGALPDPSSGVCLRASSPAQTLPKTKSVPMLTSCASVSMSTRSANAPVVTPVNALAFRGVPKRSCTRAIHAGRSPSRAMTMYTRG